MAGEKDKRGTFYFWGNVWQWLRCSPGKEWAEYVGCFDLWRITIRVVFLLLL
jgi:hypothetical protein